MPSIANTTNQLTQLILERARSFALDMVFAPADGRGTVDLTGSTITFVMKQPVRLGTATVLTKVATLTSPATGNAQLAFQALDLDLAPGIYPYSVTYVDAVAFSSTVMKGEVQILSNTDPLTANVYDTSAVTLTLRSDTIKVSVNHLRPPDIEIGNVTKVPYGTDPSAGFRGAYPLMILDLALPSGPPGSESAAIYNAAFDAAVAASAVDATTKANQAEADAIAAAAADATAKANAAQAGAIASSAGSLTAHEADTSTHGVAEIVGRTEVQALQNKDLTHVSNVFPASLATDTEVAAVSSALTTHEADTSTHGVVEIVGRTEAQTLTNKDLSSSTNIFPAAPDVQIFTADGTWNKPAGAKFVIVEAVGGGGAGGSVGAASSAQSTHAGGGGAGEYAWKKMAAAACGATETVDIGTGGTAVAGLNAGGNGAQSSFGALVIAKGGTGGSASSTAAADFWVPGGAGGTGGTGDLLTPGEAGFPGNGNGSLGMGGPGGSTRFGAGGQSRSSASAGQSLAGLAGRGYGAGGSGACATSTGAQNAGGAGAPGLVIVTTYFM